MEGNLPQQLSAKFKGSFAYPSVKDRLPVILVKAVDALCRLRPEIHEKYGEEGTEELKTIVGCLSKLKHEIQTNKPFLPLQDDRSDVALWNKLLQEDGDLQKVAGAKSSWFNSAWLLTECYFYRRIKEAIALSTHLKHVDPFQQQKQNAFTGSLQAMQLLAAHLTKVVNSDNQLEQCETNSLKQKFKEFLKFSLWGNKCDLSISGGADNLQKVNPVTQLQAMEPNLLCDDSDNIWQHLAKLKPQNTEKDSTKMVRLDIILDNAGFEFFSDLCLVEFMLVNKLADHINLHVKKMPWFVSDLTEDDFEWTLQQMSTSDNKDFSSFGKRIKGYISNGAVTLKQDDFWTSPCSYIDMKTCAPELYSDLTESDLVIFKGDLNYRKLTSDLKWAFTTPFRTSLRGFGPAPLCALRSIKCDLALGLREGQAEEAESKSKDWLITGDFAVIQSCSLNGCA